MHKNYLKESVGTLEFLIHEGSRGIRKISHSQNYGGAKSADFYTYLLPTGSDAPENSNKTKLKCKHKALYSRQQSGKYYTLFAFPAVVY